MRTSKIATLLLFFFAFSLISTSGVLAAAASQSINVHLKPDITIQVGGSTKSFFDANGKPVFPLIYQGTTYLPVRAISSLMGENIEWDGKSRTVYIGRTLSAPVKGDHEPSRSYVRDGDIPPLSKPQVQIVNALIMRDVVIMYDFEVQSFLDATGRVVYPINYQGSNYLPVRAIARLMGENIEWDEGQKLISISNIHDEHVAADNKNVKLLKGFLSDTVNVFDEGTIMILSIQNLLADEELKALVTDVGRELERINDLITDVRGTYTGGFSEKELNAYNKLRDYSESVCHYIQIIENIIYMAANGQDFSMFADTFLSFALDSQTKYEAARNAIRDL